MTPRTGWRIGALGLLVGLGIVSPGVVLAACGLAGTALVLVGGLSLRGAWLLQRDRQRRDG